MAFDLFGGGFPGLQFSKAYRPSLISVSLADQWTNIVVVRDRVQADVLGTTPLQCELGRVK